MKKPSSNCILVLVFLTGLSLLLYPTVSDYWNSFHQSQAISQYTEMVADIDNHEYETLWSQAEAYNSRLGTSLGRFTPDDAAHEDYMSQLNIGGTGVMGYLVIPSIDCELTIYHGTSDAVLQIAVGHIEGTSLPVGGESTHCVLSGHRGLPSAKLLTNLDKVVVGDLFLLQTLGQTLTYEVDQIRIVEPQDISALDMEAGKDYCTLVTCTPYGVNSHRLLVRGHRVENQEVKPEIRVTADARQIDPTLVSAAVALPLLLVLVVGVLLTGKKH